MQAPGSFSLSRQDAEQELLRGSLIQNGSLRIYALYQHNPTVKEAVDFLKEEYGIGGHSYTFWDGGDGFVDYDRKGIHFRRYADQATALLPWKEADKLLRQLIHSERYLKELESQRDAAQAELGKPFPQEQQLREKSARLAELNALLDLEGHEETPVVEASVAKEKPSVLQRLSALEPPVRPEHKIQKEEAR